MTNERSIGEVLRKYAVVAEHTPYMDEVQEEMTRLWGSSASEDLLIRLQQFADAAHRRHSDALGREPGACSSGETMTAASKAALISIER